MQKTHLVCDIYPSFQQQLTIASFTHSILPPCTTNFRGHTVPSIATQYTRNRQLHDTTARQWTQMYALPPKPIVVPNSPPPKVSKAKGKKRAEAPPTTTSRGSTSSRATRSTAAPAAATPVEVADEVIVLDSEDEAGTSSAVARGKRKRREEPNTAASGSGSSAQTQVLELGHDNQGGSSRAPTAPSQTRKRQRRGGVTANKQLGDVIVIEDD